MSENPILSISYNTPRFPGRDSHVESWFLRLNDPDSPRALWLKATILNSDDGSRSAEAWCSIFDADDTAGIRETIPLDAATFEAEAGPLTAEVAGLKLHLDENSGRTSGSLSSEGVDVSWDLELERIPGELGKPLSLLPTPKLIDAPFPKNKLLTPFPAARFNGEVRWGKCWGGGSGWF